MFSFRGTYAKITFAALSFVGGKYTTYYVLTAISLLLILIFLGEP